MKYRLGLDMGATSIGWAVYNIENDTIEDMGVRIFDDGREPKSKASLCVKRRQARGARRLQNRKRMQKAYLLKTLIQYGLFPKDKTEQQALKPLDVYALRTRALDEETTLFEFGRILFQLVQRKGFLSNRKDNREEGGKLKAGYAHLKEKMEEQNARTFGEYLYKRIQSGNSPRFKKAIDESGKFTGEDGFPFRELYIKEFEALFEAQKQYHPSTLTEELKNLLKDILFFQRPLKEAEEGMCTFEYGEKRIAKAHPLFQEFRIWQHVMNLEFCPETESEYRRLSPEEIERLVFILRHPTEYIKTKQKILTYKDIKALLGLDKKGLFNYELKTSKTDEAKGILADTTALAAGRVETVRPIWERLSETDKAEIIKIISRPDSYITRPKGKISTEAYDKLIIDYLCQRFSLSKEVGQALLYDVEWEDGFGSLSEKAIHKIVEAMKTGMTYDMACQEAGYHHSHKETKHRDFLPYYGEILEQSCIGQKDNPTTAEERYGKIANATVHVALNQVRQVVNELIRHYGQPFDISIEYARDLSASAEERQKMTKNRDDNEAENERIKKELFEKTGRSDWTHRDIEKYKIWKNMGTPKGESALNCRECPYTGDKISVSDLLNGNRFQIEHIIPFSLSLDNSYANRVIAATDANYAKGNRTPYDAFHKDEFAPRITWADIQKRIKKLPLEQQWRFGKNAMKKFEEKEGPIARSLNDTRYMTRILQNYLLPIVREDGYKTAQAVAGQLTAMVRKSWGLNLYKEDKESEEYRAYHNHHAIDAVIISAINRGQIEKTASDLKKIYPSAIERFRDELYKFKDKDTSEDERKDLRKRIKDFTREREETIINTHIQKPETIQVPKLLEQVASINISHKPKLKNVYDKASTVGQLHEDTAYGLVEFTDEESLSAKFKTGNGKDKSIVVKDVTEYIPMFYEAEDKKAYYDAFKEWYCLERKSRTLDAKTLTESRIKQELQKREKEAVLKLRQASQKAFKWFVGGGNFCAEIYQINPQNKIGGVPTKDAGEWKSEIISNYNATIRVQRGEDIFYWKNRYPNARRIMTLKRQDMVTGTFTREEAFEENFPKGIQAYVRPRFEENLNLTQTTVLFRVKKISGDGRVFLTPHNIAKEEVDTKSWMATSGSLQRYRAKQVIVSATGRIKNAP